MVADIAKLSVGREEYYTRELATDHEQYLSGHGESPGRWYGADATALGLQAKHPWPGSRPCSRAATAGRRWRGSAGGGVQVSASVGQPGGSAQASWRRMRAAEWTTWIRTLPWRVAAIVVIGVAGSLLGSLLVPRLGLAVGGLAAVMAGWGPRFRPSPGACAWRRGVAGERTPLGCSRRWNGTGG